MEGEQFSLCWNNFHNNLSSGFHSLLKEEHLVDVTLAAEGKFLKAHKTVLSVCSPFFKELFRVNPCKHPIVILPEVNYTSLCSLLHFMYQGEVSVSQEEIPTFMRVAKMLKVKGLTDNSSSSPEDANGYSSQSPHSFSDQRQNIMKRPKPVKKIIRPIQHLRPIESPQLEKSHLHHSQSQFDDPPPVKKPYMGDTNEMVKSEPCNSDFQDDFIKPKDEPVDHLEEGNNQTGLTGDDYHVDLSAMLDTTLGEPSPSHPFPTWPTPDFHPPPPQDSSTPGPVVLKSGRGQLVLIHDGHMYTLCDKRDLLSLWVCVKKKTLTCPGLVTMALSPPTLVSYIGHNHPQMHDVIRKLQLQGCLAASVSPELKL